MNERIKELLDQATIDALFETQNAVDLLDNPVTKQQRQLQLEKFAELIIRECTKLIEESTEDDEYWSRVTGAESIMAIEQHFGVEE